MLGQPDKPDMTATEVVERSLEMARLLGATYGRLQSELLTPLAHRAVGILQRRGEITCFEIDTRIVEMTYTSPLANHRRQRDAGLVREWITAVNALGPEAMKLMDPIKTSRYLAAAYGVPEDILRSDDEMAELPAVGGGDLPKLPGLGGGGDLLGALGDVLGGGAPGADVPGMGGEPSGAEPAEVNHVQ